MLSTSSQNSEPLYFYKMYYLSKKNLRLRQPFGGLHHMTIFKLILASKVYIVLFNWPTSELFKNQAGYLHPLVLP